MPFDHDLQAARDLIDFIDASPSPYHAARTAARRLQNAGFVELAEGDEWHVEPGTRAYVIRGGATIIAFIAGTKPPAEAGFLLIGAHTDSPNLRVKPQAEYTSSGFRQLGVEIYGGVLLHTWLDRDLALAGRVSLKRGESRLVQLPEGRLRVPNLAIHLQREIGSQGLQLNAQQHLAPVLGLSDDADPAKLLTLLGADGELDPRDIRGFDLCLYDAQGGALAGADQEFVYSARLDNLASCHAAIQALLDAPPSAAPTRVVALYDHEECGSQSVGGARSRLLLGILERLAFGYSGATPQAAARAFSRSLLISADMAHAVHPNYADRHEKQHQPKLGHGPVIKVNVNQSYATDGPGAAVFREACESVGITPQYFVSRSDMPCGSTIGPITAARLGLRGVDVGNPMLSMHSCREMAGTRDVNPMIRVLTALFSEPELPRASA